MTALDAVGSHDIAERVLAAYARQHGRSACVLARAPGRVNLIGEHTDYNDGFVLPAAIDRHTWVAAGPRDDGQVRVTALDWAEESDLFDPRHTEPVGGWRDHVRGTLSQIQPGGLELVIAGNVPQGAGLSSSASLGLALLSAAAGVAGRPMPPREMAQLAQRAENRFVGTQCGVMDQLASACGQADHALLIDCRSLATSPVPIPPGVALLIAHSRVRRGLVDSAYNERRRQCEEAARGLGVAALRDVTMAQLNDGRAALNPLVFRRARHVVSENMRVLSAVDALRRGDLATLSRLMAESHESMRQDFEITHPFVDQLAAILQSVAGDGGGARMTGGGFGGCVVALIPEDRVEHAIERVGAGYLSPDGEPALVFRCTASAGATARRLG
jgi:galactokinase